MLKNQIVFFWNRLIGSGFNYGTTVGTIKLVRKVCPQMVFARAVFVLQLQKAPIMSLKTSRCGLHHGLMQSNKSRPSLQITCKGRSRSVFQVVQR